MSSSTFKMYKSRHEFSETETAERELILPHNTKETQREEKSVKFDTLCSTQWKFERERFVQCKSGRFTYI